MRIRCLSLLILAVVGGCGGAGSHEGAISGVVTLDGQPLKGVMVRFQSAEGKVFSGKTDDTGLYQISQSASMTGAPPGKYDVFVTDPNKGSQMDEQGKPVPTESAFPEKYEDPETSGLTADVKSGANTYDFGLTSK